MRAAPLAALLSLAVLDAAVAGCGGDDGGGGGSGGAAATTTGTGGGGTGGGAQGVACDGQPAALALEGTWAMYARMSIDMVGVPGGAITICPVDQVGEATLLLLLTMKQDPADPAKLTDVRATLCSVELPLVTALVGSCDPESESLVETQLIAPPPFIAALPNVPMKAVSGTLAGTTPGSSLALERLYVTVGADAAQGTAMPSWDPDAAGCASPDVGHTDQCEAACVSGCAAMRDDDGDGYPGVTLHVCGYTPSDRQSGIQCKPEEPSDPGATIQGAAFIDFHVDPVLNGDAKSSCELAGTVESSVLYNIVGADVYLAGAPITVASAIKSLPLFTVNAADSRFRAIRVDGQYGAPSWNVDPTSPAAACEIVLQHVNDF